MINPEDLRVDVLSCKPKQFMVGNNPTFVKIEHKPSKITVTKYNRSQYKAKEEGLEELEMLVEIWAEGRE